MATITLTECDPYSGSYALDLGQAFNNGELNIIKTISGARVMEIPEALGVGDSDLILSFALVALLRAGKINRRQAPTVAELLWEAPAGSLRFEADASDGDANPPDGAPPSADPSRSSESASGSDSSTGSENQG